MGPLHPFETTWVVAILWLLSDAYDIDTTERVGEFELVIEDGTTVECDLDLMSN